jgi:hypothetical protein
MQITNSSIPLPSPIQQAAQLEDALNKSLITLAGAGSKTIAGRGCKAVDATYDIAKFYESQGLKPQNEGIISLTQKLCYDDKMGLPLQFDMVMVVKAEDGEVTVTLKTLAGEVKESASAIAMPTGAKVTTYEDVIAGLMNASNTSGNESPGITIEIPENTATVANEST